MSGGSGASSAPSSPEELDALVDLELTEHQIWGMLRDAILRRNDPVPLLCLLDMIEPDSAEPDMEP